ncbi:hydrophilic protein [Sistotremastrum niveocremeum HHB9708]|uniref:Hydrophilic protein n=1 Tax=Sistotremastrum niveocremeum HHB9708 TaxID=1314777 RepID=A0A164UIQ0_9AGAM|nr:hydrophilic protein [Sistotremastrum niveocremeum HHB9708]
MPDRFTTPPPQPAGNVELNLTPEQVRRVELNRLKAKARQRELEQTASSSTSHEQPNANNKRPLQAIPATSTSPTVPVRKEKPLKRDSRLGKYFEYDLSKMVNSKGGFLVEDDMEANDDERRKEKERERQRAVKNLEPPVHLEKEKNPKCGECLVSMDIDHQFRNVFGVNVCHRCKNDKPEKYSLLTKTECREDYLLTDSELKDEDELPHILKANPHKATWNNMMLFLRMQVEAFALKKWGTFEALDAEFVRRENDKKKKKGKKFEEGLKELRRRTREGVWQKRRDAEHQHVFGDAEITGDDGEAVQRCRECGFEVEIELL